MTDRLRTAEEPAPPLADRLGYLIKHAQLRVGQLTSAALAPLGISGRECAVLIVVNDRSPLSQQALASRMGVDRTTMVGLVDTLEDAGLLERRPDPDDRRRNVIALTERGLEVVQRAVAASEEAERAALSSLSEAECARFKETLRRIAFPAPE